MIYVFMRGRLGNQLFQYAFARTLQCYNTNEKIVYIFDDVYKSGEKKDGWENSLKYFNTVDVIEGDSKQLNLSLIQKIVMKLYWKRFPHNSSIENINQYQMRWGKLLNKVGLYYLDLGYFPFTKTINKKDIIISGNFESEKYFKEIRNQLKKEITPIYPELDSNKELYNEIRNTNSICISIRRGDFVDNPQFSKLLNVCTKKYFTNAVNEMKKRVENPVLFIFSDDIEWAKKNLKFELKCFYEKGTDPVWEKLRLMYSCKHFVISNSTFSWWAQYLGGYEDKIVIAPEKWYNSNYVPAIIQEEWIRVKGY